MNRYEEILRLVAEKRAKQTAERQFREARERAAVEARKAIARALEKPCTGR